MLPITAYTEALGCEIQKSPHLQGLHLNTAEEVIYSKHTISFPLQGRGKSWRLTIATTDQFPLSEASVRLRTLATQSPDNPFAPAEYISDALVVYDSLGVAHTLSALLQEAHTPLIDFIRRNCSTKRRGHLRTALESIYQRVKEGFTTHGSLTSKRIEFDEGGELYILDYPIIPEAQHSDTTALAKAALMLYIGASDIDSFKALIALPTGDATELTRRLRCILSAAEHHGSTRLATLCRAVLNNATDGELLAAIGALCNERFAPLEILCPLLTSRSPEGPVAIAKQTLPPDEVVWVDFALCDRVEMASDNIVRYKQGDHWGYAYTDGQKIIIEREIIAAYDFEEGRAVIRTPRGYGLVDSSGRVVMNDVWEQLAWYGDENVCVGGDTQGRWYIYDRMGRQLSTVGCDFMGDASEGFVVARRGGRYGYFSTDGKRHTDFIYDEAYSFSGGRALVRRKGGPYFHIDTSFHRVVE